VVGSPDHIQRTDTGHGCPCVFSNSPLAIGRNRYVARDRIHATGSAVTKNQQQRTVFMPIPAPVDNIASFGSTLAGDANAIVSVRQNWWDSWTLREDIACTSVTWQVAPNVGHAQLRRRYGPTIERDGSKTNRTKLNLDGWYVRILVICPDGQRLWHGFVDDTGEESTGFVSMNEIDEAELPDIVPIVVQRPTGVQTYTCAGMLASLDRSPIMATMFRTTVANEGTDLEEMRWAGSAPHFNPTVKPAHWKNQQGERQLKTRTAAAYDVPDMASGDSTAIVRQSHIFGWPNLYSIADDNALVDYWYPRNIAEYLVAYASPRNKDFSEVIPIELAEPTQIPDFGTPDLDCDGLSLKQCMDRLLSANQGLGYWVYVDEEENRLVVKPFTSLMTSLTVGTGKTIAANDTQFDLFVVSDPSTDYTLQKAVSTLANQVVIRGARRQTVFTVPFARFAGTWTTAEVTAFDTEFPTSVDLAAQHARRDAMEQSRWRHLYRNFQFLRTWDWRVTTNDIDFDHVFLSEAPNALGLFTADERYLPYPGKMQVVNHLPLKDRIDYSTGDKIAEHRDSRAPFRVTNIYGKAFNAGYNGTSNTLVDGHPLSWVERAKRHTLYSISDPDYSLTVHPLDSEHTIGIQIDVNGAPQTIMGAGVDPISHLPALVYSSLFVTIAMEDDRHVEQHYPAPADLDDVDNVLRKVVDYGDKFQLIELLPGTIVGFDSNDFLRRDERTFVRDDRDEMLELAKQMYAWFRRIRQVVRLNSRRCSAVVWPGQLVKTLNDLAAPVNQHAVPVECVVTEVAIRLPAGLNGSETKPEFSMVTDRGEVDWLFYAPKAKA
jgi:hypothetical protein